MHLLLLPQIVPPDAQHGLIFEVVARTVVVHVLLEHEGSYHRIYLAVLLRVGNKLDAQFVM